MLDSYPLFGFPTCAPLRFGVAIPMERWGRVSLVEIPPATAALLDLCRELGQAIAVAVEPRSFDTYSDLVRAFAEGEVDLA